MHSELPPPPPSIWVGLVVSFIFFAAILAITWQISRSQRPQPEPEPMHCDKPPTRVARVFGRRWKVTYY